jgi:hypothetical protein
MVLSRASLRTAAALLAVALTAGGCAALAVSSYGERGFDVRRYRTFAWGPPDTFSTGDPRLDSNRFFAERVRMRVEQELAARGFERTTSASPDLLVHYHASVTQEIDTGTFDREYQHGDQASPPDVYDAGTLVIDLVDARARQLVWRGWAKGSVEGLIDDQQWLEKRIDDAVTRILSRLPRRL